MVGPGDYFKALHFSPGQVDLEKTNGTFSFLTRACTHAAPGAHTPSLSVPARPCETRPLNREAEMRAGILASHWSRKITWPGYWPLIGREAEMRARIFFLLWLGAWGSHDGHSHLRQQPTLALMIMIYCHVDTLLFYFANFIFATIIYILFSYKCVSNKYQRSFWVFIMTILTLFISFMVLGKFIWQCLIRAET